MLVSSMTHFVWLISYDSYLYFSRYSDGYHLAMVAIYFDRLGAQSGFQKYRLIHMIHDSSSFFTKQSVTRIIWIGLYFWKPIIG